MKVATKSEHGWAFYIPLAYFVFFFLQPILDHAGWKEWLLTGLGTVIFLVLYLGILVDRTKAMATGRPGRNASCRNPLCAVQSGGILLLHFCRRLASLRR